jgi:hypothetical protein
MGPILEEELFFFINGLILSLLSLCGRKKGSVMTSELLEKPEGKEIKDQFNSVEISIDGLDLPYQFKIWENRSTSMNVLIKEDSGVLPLLKVGDTFNMKYYSSKSIYPLENVKTAISHITKNDRGRLKGHYLVGLEILSR